MRAVSAPLPWPPPPPRLPPGWHAVHRVDRSTGQPTILIRLRPLWRRVLTVAAVGGIGLLAVYLVLLDRHGQSGPMLWFMGLVVVSGSIGLAFYATTQDGWLLTPAGLVGGRIWVSNGNFRRPPDRVVALQLKEADRDDVPTVHLIAIFGARAESEIFHEVDSDTRAEPLIAWLSTAARLPIRPRELRRR
jgi:hypothetical protein